MPEDNRLFSEFSPSTYEEWRQAAEKALKGAPFEKKLVSSTYEDIDLQPLYRQENTEDLPHVDTLPGFPPYVRSITSSGYRLQPWDICQEISYGTPEECNRAARFDLAHGQTALNLVLDSATLAGIDASEADIGAVGYGGVSISSVEDMAKAFDGIDIEQVPIFVQAGISALPLVALLVAYMRKHNKSVAKLHGCIGMDPLGTLVHSGSLPLSLHDAYTAMAQLVSWTRAHAPALQTILIQSHPYHDGGGSATQELAFALATGVEYLREMQNRGVAIDDAAVSMRFSFSLGSQFFMEIAKLRAARLLWAKIVSAFGGNEDAQKMHIHARTSWWNKTVYDPYVNMLRTTTEAFAGAMGGSNSMHVGRFDETVRPADDFSRRMARNIQIMLQTEASLFKVIDPAGGSWYVETLTDQVARKAWQLFQEVEKQGGMFKALQARFPQTQVGSTAEKRAKNIALRRDIFVGTNMYPNLKEPPLNVSQPDDTALHQRRSSQVASYRDSVDASQREAALDTLVQARDTISEHPLEAAAAAALAGATLGDLSIAVRSSEGTVPTVDAVRVHRGSEQFESLRKASEQYAARTGSRPRVFLANMGPIPQHKGRADFTTGFFEVGGFDVIGNNGFATVEDAAQAAGTSLAPIVVICSTDDTYPELVPPLTRLIKQADPEAIVILAGYPQDQIEAHKAAGVDDFIHLRSNCYEMLVNLQKKIGVIL